MLRRGVSKIKAWLMRSLCLLCLASEWTQLAQCLLREMARNYSLRSIANQSRCDARDVLALKPAHFELERGRHAQLRARAGDATRAVGRATGYLPQRGEVFERVGQADDDHSVVQQRQMEGGRRRFLAPVLACGAA